MKYAIVNGKREEAFSKGRGKCISCEKEMIAKCGNKIMKHWAHKPTMCDNWWENETPWHRKWKNEFPKEWQEIIHTDPLTGEKHIADVKTKKGIVIEFQNSPMNDVELNSREEFYKKMIWIVNGEKFKKNFHIFEDYWLPKPKSDFAREVRFYPKKHKQKGNIFHRITEDTDNNLFGLMESISVIKSEIKANYIGHHVFDWVRPRSVWLEAKCGVFIDFGDDFLCKIVDFHNNGYSFKCIRKIEKKYFLERALK